MKVRKIEWGFYDIKCEGCNDSVSILFHYDSKRHKYIAHFNWEGKEKEFTEKQGETIIEFLDWLESLTVEESFDSQGDPYGDDFGEVDEYFADPQELKEFLGDYPDGEDEELEEDLIL